VSVVVHIPAPLRPLAGGLRSVVVEPDPRTVEGALQALWSAHPALRDPIVDERGQVRPHVNVFVGAESIRNGAGLATAVSDGSQIAIIPAVSGGR
jgi:molybdopterin converting factor small subunit